MVNDQNKRKLDCKYCGKVFKSHNYVKTHEKLHEGEPKHKCLYCGRKFRYPSELKIHNSIHTGEDPYKCAICGKGFGWAQTLNEHIRIYHAVQKDSHDHIKKEYTIPSTNSINVKQENYDTEDSSTFATSSLNESVTNTSNHQRHILFNNNETSQSNTNINEESFHDFESWRAFLNQEDYSVTVDPFKFPFQTCLSKSDISQNISKEADRENSLGLNNNQTSVDEALSFNAVFNPWQAEPSLTLLESFDPNYQSLTQPNPEYASLLPIPGSLNATPFCPEQMNYNSKQEFVQLDPAQNKIHNRLAQLGIGKKKERKTRIRRQTEVVSEDWRPDSRLPDGWMIRVHTRQNTRVSGSYQRDVYYKAPCGQKIGSREAVVEYLRKRGASDYEVAKVRNGYKNYKRKPLATAVNAAEAVQKNAVVGEQADCAKCKKIKEIETIIQELKNHLC